MKRYLALIAAALALVPCTFAQNATGTLTGTITDPSGGIVPNASVSVENQSTNVRLAAAAGTPGSIVTSANTTVSERSAL